MTGADQIRRFDMAPCKPHDQRALTSTRVQSRTAVAYACPYTQSMQTDHLKAALIGLWILFVGVLGYALGATSLVGWTVLAAMAATPPAMMMRLWRTPSQSMSESIREVLR